MDKGACQGCGTVVGVEAAICPQCGRNKPHAASALAKGFLIGLAGLVLLLIFLF